MAMRTITIEAGQGVVLQAKIDEKLVEKFIRTATKKKGPFRSTGKSFQHALESAVITALSKFIEG